MFLFFCPLIIFYSYTCLGKFDLFSDFIFYIVFFTETCLISLIRKCLMLSVWQPTNRRLLEGYPVCLTVGSLCLNYLFLRYSHFNCKFTFISWKQWGSRGPLSLRHSLLVTVMKSWPLIIYWNMLVRKTETWRWIKFAFIPLLLLVFHFLWPCSYFNNSIKEKINRPL